jgi:hypothetical protein
LLKTTHFFVKYKAGEFDNVCLIITRSLWFSFLPCNSLQSTEVFKRPRSKLRWYMRGEAEKLSRSRCHSISVRLILHGNRLSTRWQRTGIATEAKYERSIFPRERLWTRFDVFWKEGITLMHRTLL